MRKIASVLLASTMLCGVANAASFNHMASKNVFVSDDRSYVGAYGTFLADKGYNKEWNINTVDIHCWLHDMSCTLAVATVIHTGSLVLNTVHYTIESFHGNKLKARLEGPAATIDLLIDVKEKTVNMVRTEEYDGNVHVTVSKLVDGDSVLK